MEENLTAYENRRLLPVLSEEEAGNYSPLVLAFTGDAIFELVVRTMLVQSGHGRPSALNREKASIVEASSQSAMMEAILPVLTEAEEAVYRRGRNAKSYTKAKHASIVDYRRATGFEALLGYLYLCGRKARLLELIDIGLRSKGQ